MDTSAWIEYLRASNSRVDLSLTEAVERSQPPALRLDAPVLAQDRDFEVLADVSALRLA